MAQRKLRFALFGNVYQAKKSVSIQKILSFLSEHKAEIYIEKEFFEFLTQGQHYEVVATRIFEGRDFDADFVISMGGDGTFLKAAHYVGNKQIPIMGVNMGRLGFLADVGPSDIESSLKALYAGEFKLEDHAVIQVEADGKTFETCPCALNDIAVLKRDNASMISIRTNVNGEYLVTYQADGLIVSTPTGSTAYSLSNGGPIIVPESDILCLTPVAPHSLNIRPIVVRDDAVLDITTRSRAPLYQVSLDGQCTVLKSGTSVRIARAPHTTGVIQLQGTNFAHTLRHKLMWGKDNR